MRYFIRLSYLGTAYNGWQQQPAGQGLGIQQVISDALSTILRQKIEIVGAGRTDTGVHARCMYAHADIQAEIPSIDKLIGRLNSFLPQDIAIHDMFPVRDSAHVRFDATQREYQYHIHTRKDPFCAHTSCHFFHPLDVEAMNQACEILKEYEDFQCFSKVNTDVHTFICHISHAHWDYDADSGHMTFTIRADRFLRNMVRAIVGTMLDIGRGKMAPEELRDVIQSKNRSDAGMSAPAHGLSLTNVEYPWNDILI